MILDVLREAGGWAWVTAGMALLALELLAPGVFLTWIGLAALSVGAISILGLPIGEWLGFWDWRAQAITFAGLSLAFVLIGRRFTAAGDDPATDRPGGHLRGRTGTLAQGIEGGVGRVRLGETLYRVEGPELPAGTRVTVIDDEGGTLRVAPEGSVPGAELPHPDPNDRDPNYPGGPNYPGSPNYPSGSNA